MTNKIHVIPCKGGLVRDPSNGKAIDAAGELVPNTTFWRRRLRDGSVTLKPAPKAASHAEARRTESFTASKARKN